jgi:transposase
MQGFVQGADRQQTTLLPECLDDWVDEGNSVRVVDCFVDALEAPAAMDLSDQQIKATTKRSVWIFAID